MKWSVKKWRVDKMTIWWNDKFFKCLFDEIMNRWNNQWSNKFYLKGQCIWWPNGKVFSYSNRQLVRWSVDEMTSWWNYKLIKHLAGKKEKLMN